MSDTNVPKTRKQRFNWRDDLAASHDLSRNEISAFGFVLGWFENWRISKNLSPGVEAARSFWKEAVKQRPREPWQLEQWAQGIRWYLNWLTICQRYGHDGRSLPERLKIAIHSMGARRGLALETRKTYAGCLMRFGRWAETEARVMNVAVAREWLTHLIVEKQVSSSTQHQTLNALVRFYKNVCGMDEVDLEVKFRKREKRQPVILNKKEVMAIIERLEPKYKIVATLQYGAGLRLKELVTLRIKDIDLERGVVTIHGGKGDKDRESVIPNCLKEGLEKQIALSRELWEKDRLEEVPGVALPGGLARKMPKAGKRWAWHWLFPATTLSTDPESKVVRRHHLHEKVYGAAFKRAAEKEVPSKRVTTHAFRHAFATHLVDGGTDIRTLQELLGHADVKTTEIYAHASKIGNEKGVRSPLDALK